MFRGKWRHAAWGALLIGSLVGLPAQADDWLKAESENFVIWSNTNQRVTLDYVKKLESFKYLTDSMLGKDPASKSRSKFEVYLLEGDDALRKVRPKFSQWVAGVYMTCSEGVSAYSALLGKDYDGSDLSQVVLFHEYSHHIMFQHGKMVYPAWYREGFADYMGTVEFKTDKLSVGQVATMRSSTLSYGRWIGFDKIIGLDYNETNIDEFYAQSWLLTHYMLSDPTRARQLNDYFIRLTKGEESIPAFEAATGLEVNKLSGVLQRYSRKIPYIEIRNTTLPDAAITLTPLPKSVDAYLLDASVLETCVDGDYGKVILKRLREKKATVGKETDYRLALARAEILFGDPLLVEEDLFALTQAEPDNFEAFYLTGRLYSRLAWEAKDAEQVELMEIARGAYIAAYKINKFNAPNLFFLAQTYTVQADYPSPSALNAAQGANVLSPGVYDYASMASYALLLADKRPEAAAALRPFANDPHNRTRAQNVTDAIAAINEGKDADAVGELLNRKAEEDEEGDGKGPPPKKPDDAKPDDTKAKPDDT